MGSAFNIKKGSTIIYQDEPCEIMEYNHVKPGKGPAYVQVTLRNLISQRSAQVRFRSNETVEDAFIEKKKVQFLYKDDTGFHFMSLDDYNTLTLDTEAVDDKAPYLKENMEVDLAVYKERPLKLNLPTTVTLKVISTIPGIKGDSVTNIHKPATVETGYELQVPLFINEGETIKVDTRTGEYQGRA